MSISRETTKIRYRFDESDGYGGYRSYQRESGALLVSSRNVTDTTKRARPLDGFMFATTRSYESELANNGVFSYEDYSRNRRWGYPIFELYPPGQPLVDSGGRGVPYPVTSLDRELMYNAIRNEIRGTATNLANNLGEYRQTAQLFRDLAQTVASRGRNLLKRHPAIGRARRMVDIPSTAANAHLQFQYGIKPLANDLGTAVAELTTRVKTLPLFIEGVVARKETKRIVAYQSPNSTIFGTKAKVEYELQTKFRTQWRAYLNQNMLTNTLAQHGMLNPVSLAWELMPYSFVLDWWVNVGDVLQSLDNLILIDSLMVMDSRSDRSSQFVIPSGSGIFQTGSAFYSKRVDKRQSPLPISRVASFKYKPSTSWGHILNGMALLQQARR